MKKKYNEIENESDLLVLVNKNNKLSKKYIPENLELINNKFLRKEAKRAFFQLYNDASSLGYDIDIASGYRSYEYQKNLYDYYVKEKGEDYASKCCAKAGHSEHQTGLALDVMGSNLDYDLFAESIEFEWMINNCYKYGFILRYPKDKENITGFKSEPWHYRYVGVEVATYIHNNNLTFEEYLNNL